MISVIATITLNPGTREKFLEVFNANVPAVLAEDGCHEYFPAIDVDAKIDAQTMDENEVIVIEKWASTEALHAHLEAPHMLEFRTKAADMVAGVSLKILQNASA